MNRSELEANTGSRCQARENGCEQVTIGFGFSSDWPAEKVARVSGMTSHANIPFRCYPGCTDALQKSCVSELVPLAAWTERFWCNTDCAEGKRTDDIIKYIIKNEVAVIPWCGEEAFGRQRGKSRHIQGYPAGRVQQVPLFFSRQMQRVRHKFSRHNDSHYWLVTESISATNSYKSIREFC